MVAALGSAILSAAAKNGGPASGSGDGSGPVAAPSPKAIADSGLQSPAQIAQGFAALDPASRTDFAALLDAIDSAPPSGRFTSLTDAQRQAFIPQALAPLAPRAVSSAQIESLDAFWDADDADYDIYAADVESGKLSENIVRPFAHETPDPPQGAPQTFPVPPPPSASVVRANALLAGLRLVATQPAPPPPASPPPPPPPPGVIASLVAELTAGVAPANLPQSLIDQLTAGGGGSGGEPPPPPLPAPALNNALGVWISGA